MPTKLDAAVAALERSYAAFPMPMTNEVALTAMIIAGVLLVGMLYFQTRVAAVTTRNILAVCCTIGVAIVVLALGNSSVRNRDAAQATARSQMASECRGVQVAAAAEPQETLTPDRMRTVLGICGPQTLATMDHARRAGQAAADPAGQVPAAAPK